MVTLSVVPNFKGNLKDKFACLAACLLLDSAWILPTIAAIIHANS